MSDAHEAFLQRLFGGRRTPGSGNGFANQMDVRNNRDDPLPLAIDGKSTFGKSVGVTLEMWEKAVEQAGDLTPVLALRWYAKDNTLTPKRDLVVVDAHDFAEMIQVLREVIHRARMEPPLPPLGATKDEIFKATRQYLFPLEAE